MSGTVFADTFYWVALISRRDDARSKAHALSQRYRSRGIVTTEEVLVETLNFFSSHAPEAKERAVRAITVVLNTPDIRVIPQTTDSFRAGLDLYRSRLDKGYSLTDCISMNVMREESITEILTNDDHFVQEGFRALFRDAE